MIQEMFLKGFLITFPEIFLLGVEIFFYIFSFIKKSFPEIFLKSFRNTTENISLEKVCKKNFGEALKNLVVTFLKVLGWEQERPISARRVRTFYLDSARKNVLSPLGA